MGEISFAGQVVVVTGAGGGLGRTYALEFARRGARVVVNEPGFQVDGSGGSREPADAVVREIEAAGGTAVACYDAVGTPEAGEAIVQQAVDAFGRIDALVTNAGILRNADLEDLTPDILEATLRVHLEGSLWTAIAAFRRMKAQGYGRLVFVASSHALFGSTEASAYCAAKAGVIGFANGFSLEGAEHGVVSNTLMPIAFGRMQGARKVEIPELTKALGALKDRLAPEFVTPLVTYLASSACQSTGHVYSSVAGRYARVAIAVPDGWVAPAEAPPSAEDIAGHWDEITARHNLHEPESTNAELMHLASRLS